MPVLVAGLCFIMPAVLIVLVTRYGLEGIWVAGLFSGFLLLLIGILRLGRFIAFIPAPVISGFTSGIALIIFIGQIDNFLESKPRLLKPPRKSSLDISPHHFHLIGILFVLPWL